MIPRVRMARKRLAIARERTERTERRWIETLRPLLGLPTARTVTAFSTHLRAAKLLRAIQRRKDPTA